MTRNYAATAFLPILALAFILSYAGVNAQWFAGPPVNWTPAGVQVGLNVPAAAAVPPLTSLFVQTAGTGSVVFTGTNCAGGLNPNLGAGARFMWDPGQAAIRSGCVNGTQWDAPNVGCYSVAMGQDVTASATASIAMGAACVAGHDFAVSMGEDNSVLGPGHAGVALGGHNRVTAGYAVAIGGNNQALIDYGIAIGEDNIAQGPGHAMIAMGGHNLAGADYAVAIGGNNQALQGFSVAMGEDNQVTGIDHAGVAIGGHNRVDQGYGVAIGEDNQVVGGPGPHAGVAIGGHNVSTNDYAVALGRGNQANGSNSMAIGHDNQANATCAFAVGGGVVNTTTNSYALGFGGPITMFVTSGHVGINYTAQTPHALHVNGTSWTSLGAWSGSDARYKNNISTLSGGLDAVMQLRPVSYEWNANMFPGIDVPQEREIGFIAQELEKVVPQVVRTNADGYKGVAYEDLTAVLAAAIQEQQVTIEQQQADNEILRETVNELMKEVTRLKEIVLKTTGTGTGDGDLERSGVLLNDPNPFSNSTTIGYHIDASVQNAELVIMESAGGREVYRVRISDRGEGSALISARNLGAAGTYLYSLVIDGRTVGTKKMVLVK